MKYKAVRTTVDGIPFASKKEARRYEELKMLRVQRIVSDIQLQPKFKIEVNGKFICHYIADFCYIDHARHCSVIYEDVKGYKTPVYKLKKKLTEALFNITIHEV